MRLPPGLVSTYPSCRDSFHHTSVNSSGALRSSVGMRSKERALITRHSLGNIPELNLGLSSSRGPLCPSPPELKGKYIRVQRIGHYTRQEQK